MQSRFSRVPRSGRGFTLIELLVVISIIAILAGLALPALQGALNAAKKAQANAMASQLKVAVTGFNTEYGTWPGSPASDTTITAAVLYHTLIGDNTGTGTSYGNTRQIVFMEFATKDLDSATSPTQFVDPWDKKATKQNYHVMVDGDFDNTITIANAESTAITNGQKVNASVVVFDVGPPAKASYSNWTYNTTAASAIKTW